MAQVAMPAGTAPTHPLNDEGTMEPLTHPLSPEKDIISPLWKEIQNKDAMPDYLKHVSEALQTDGYCVIPNILTDGECDAALEEMWTFVEDTSNGLVDRANPSSWYSKESSKNNSDDDPWPHTGYASFPDMFQTLGAGYVLGETVRLPMAKRVFEPLFGTHKLHSSKEGFTFHRPTDSNKDNNSDSSQKSQVRVCGKVQIKSRGHHYDQGHDLEGLHTIQSSVALTDQVEPHDGCFSCYPGSHSAIHQELTADIYRGKSSWVPLSDEEVTHILEDKYGLQSKQIWVPKGTVLLWRSDLVHAGFPSNSTQNFRAVAYTSMLPASFTPSNILDLKMDAYKQAQTGDHRPHVESWHRHNKRSHGRPFYRMNPPLVSIRVAQLYGILPYCHDEEELLVEMARAMVRGVRFFNEDDCTSQSMLRSPTRPCEARIESLVLENGTKLLGQDKYLGGVASPCGGYIYGVPGHAKRVLRCNTETNAVDFIGPSFSGNFKWLRGVEIPASAIDKEFASTYPRGCCLALPSNDKTILKINPHTNDVITFGAEAVKESDPEKISWLYHGGNLASNGYVYAIPANAERVLKIHPVHETATLIGPTFVGRQKWFGGIMGGDGCIYGIPQNANGVLKINPITDHVEILAEGILGDGQWKWHGGLASNDGLKIFGFPNNSDEVLVIDTLDGRVYTIGDSTVLKSGRHRHYKKAEAGMPVLDHRYKYLGGASTADGKYVYLFPCDAERVLRIDVENDSIQTVGPLLLEGENKYQNGFCGRDGCLYGIPQRAAGILRIIPPSSSNEEEHVDTIYCGDDMVGLKDKCEGGVLGPTDECIYAIPLRAKAMLKLIPGPTKLKK